MAVNVLLIKDDARCTSLVRDPFSQSDTCEIECVHTRAHGLERLRAVGRQSRDKSEGIGIILVGHSSRDDRMRARCCNAAGVYGWVHPEPALARNAAAAWIDRGIRNDN